MMDGKLRGSHYSVPTDRGPRSPDSGKSDTYTAGHQAPTPPAQKPGDVGAGMPRTVEIPIDTFEHNRDGRPGS